MKLLYQMMGSDHEAEVSWDEESGRYWVFVGEGFENNDAKFYPDMLLRTLDKMKQTVIRHQAEMKVIDNG